MHDSNALAALIGGSCFVLALVAVAILLVPMVFYCISMQKALRLAGPENRSMEPGLVWLLFIPLFHLVWHFFVVKNVSDAAKKWAAAQGRDFGDGGWPLGLTACILACCFFIPVLGALAGLGSLVCLIIWWVKVAGFSAIMEGRAQ